MRLLSFILFAFAISFQLHAGGPWVEQKHSGSYFTNLNFVIYKTMSDEMGNTRDLPRRVSDIGLTNYLEYGVAKNLALFANIELKYVGSSSKTFPSTLNSAVPSGKLFGLGNSSLGLKYNFLNKKVLLSLSFAMEFPATSSKASTGLRTGIPSFSFVPGLHFGQGFQNGIYYYIEGFFAARNNYSHEWRLNGELGYDFKRPLVMALFVNARQSLNNKIYNDNSNFINTGLFLNNQEFVAWSLKFIYEMKENMGITAALSGGATTKLIARTPVISAGFYIKWNSQRAKN